MGINEPHYNKYKFVTIAGGISREGFGRYHGQGNKGKI